MVNLVPLSPEYCEQVYEIARECLPEHWSLDGIRDVLRYDNNIYYVVIEQQSAKVVGFGGMMIVADEAELLNIAVTESFRCQGIAKDILKQLLEDACKIECSRMLLEVRENNVIAQHLYDKMGFVKIGIRNNYYSNPMDNAIIMHKIFD